MWTSGFLDMFLQINVELALRHNPAIVLTDSIPLNATESRAKFVNINDFKNGAKSFGILYKHMAKDKSEKRFKYELQCFQRWYILRDYMTANKIPRVRHLYL